MSVSKFSVILSATLFVVFQLGASPLTLEAPSSVIYQQTLQAPCIFGDPSCHNPAGFDYVVFPPGGGVTIYDELSLEYTVGQIVGVLGGNNMFSVGIDINTAAGTTPEVLESFEMLINGLTVQSYTGPSVLSAVNNGTGYSDSRLLGFDLSPYSGTDKVQFSVKISNATDGRENLFLIGQQTAPVPEPAVLYLLGPALAGVFLLRRRLIQQ